MAIKTLYRVTTFTMPVHLHGTYFVSFLLLTGSCYDAETSVILLLLDMAFAFCKVLERSMQGIFQGYFEGGEYLACEPVVGGSWGCIIILKI